MFTEFQDTNLTDEEHHAHPALGSTRLKGYLSDAAPSKSAAALGTATHILAFQPHLADSIAEKPAFKADVEQWMREHAGTPVELGVRYIATGSDDKVVELPKFTGEGARSWQVGDFRRQHGADKLYLSAKDHAKALEVAEALRLHRRGARLLLAPSELDKARTMARALCRCEGLQRLLERPDAQWETTVLALHSLGIWTKARPDMRGAGRIPGVGPCRIVVDAKTTGAVDDDAFAKDVASLGYDMQQAFYGDVEQDRWEQTCVRYIYAVRKMPSRDDEHKVFELRLPDTFIDVGRKKYTAALVKAAIERKTQARPALHWEGPHELPEPPPWVVQKAERIERHARRLAEQHGIDYPEE